MDKAKGDIEQALDTAKVYILPKRTDYTIAQLKAKLKRTPRRNFNNEVVWNEIWKHLYDSYPELLESAEAFNRGEQPEWYTQDMVELIGEGATPLEAYRATKGILN